MKDVGRFWRVRKPVKEGLIDEVGGMSEALNKLHEMIDQSRQKSMKICNDSPFKMIYYK